MPSFATLIAAPFMQCCLDCLSITPWLKAAANAGVVTAFRLSSTKFLKGVRPKFLFAQGCIFWCRTIHARTLRKLANLS
jgi:hypothetical protein